MAELFLMPRLGQSMVEGTILQWFKAEGDSVRSGEPLVEVMSDKANFDVESTADGVVRKILVPANETVPVNAPLAIVGAADEPIEAMLLAASPAAAGGVESLSAASDSAGRV